MPSLYFSKYIILMRLLTFGATLHLGFAKPVIIIVIAVSLAQGSAEHHYLTYVVITLFLIWSSSCPGDILKSHFLLATPLPHCLLPDACTISELGIYNLIISSGLSSAVVENLKVKVGSWMLRADLDRVRVFTVRGEIVNVFVKVVIWHDI